jgi:hypothetical protein
MHVISIGVVIHRKLFSTKMTSLLEKGEKKVNPTNLTQSKVKHPKDCQPSFHSHLINFLYNNESMDNNERPIYIYIYIYALILK